MTAISSVLLKRERIAVLEFQKKLKEVFGPRLKEMRIFGSKVRGTDRLYSDIDVAVFLDVPRIDYKIRDTVYGLAWEGLYRHDLDISPLIYTVGEFKDLLKRERLIARTIEEEGIRL